MSKVNLSGLYRLLGPVLLTLASGVAVAVPLVAANGAMNAERDSLAAITGPGVSQTPIASVTVTGTRTATTTASLTPTFTSTAAITAAVSVTPVTTGTAEAKVTICHRTGSEHNPYMEITVSQNALPAHRAHGDIIPAPPGGCPTEFTQTATITASPTGTMASPTRSSSTATSTPMATNTGTPFVSPTASTARKITICHATGSASNPYVLITIDINSLNGHRKHAGDIIPAPAGGCPAARQQPAPTPPTKGHGNRGNSNNGNHNGNGNGNGNGDSNPPNPPSNSNDKGSENGGNKGNHGSKKP